MKDQKARHKEMKKEEETKKNQIHQNSNAMTETNEENVRKRKAKIEKVLDHYMVVTFMTLVTVYALFFDDIRIIAFPKYADNFFFTITFIGICCFTAEILFASYAKKEYLYSFFFWLDIVSTISMIPDCGWFWEFIIGIDDGGTSSAFELAKASKSGRVTRIIRVIRLIRLIRIVKLYKQSQIARQKAVQSKKQKAVQKTKTEKSHKTKSDHTPGLQRRGSDNQIEPINGAQNNFYDSERDSQESHSIISEEESASSEGEEELQIPDESKISKILSDKATRTVVILVLVMLFSTQICQPENFLT